ncbi:long-chain-fatty-acid--CoA ligase [Cytobacillus sp. FSL R5-0569]|uniref:long-chain-fatty-acid--CoA ligase n=1 Tax=Cytobacillus sp. FSL R5-0569 TaxID=2921649 RepID=UPI0030F69D05
MQTRHFDHWPKLPKKLIVPETSVYQNLEFSALQYPSREAIHYYGNEISFKQLLDEVKSVSSYLQTELQVKKGDKVLLFMQNSPQFVISFYSIMRIGAVVVPINPMLVTSELAFYINDCQIETAVIGQELQPIVKPLIEQTSLKHLLIASYSDYIDPQDNIDRPDVVAEPRKEWTEEQDHFRWDDAIKIREIVPYYTSKQDDLIVLPYTSGTTGVPKGCMHTNYSVQANTVGGALWGRISSSNVILSSLPFFHVTGMVQSMHVPIYAGSTMVIMTRWNKDTALQLIERKQCSNWTAISTMLIDFISNPKLTADRIASLIGISGGGATLPEAVGQKLEKLTGLTFLEGYGLTETIAQTHSNPTDHPKMQCLGIPFFDVDARIIDPITNEELGIDEVGEIIIHGHQVMKGYYNRPEENESAFITIEGKQFFRTGDLGKVDEEGYFFIVDRVKRMINSSGYKIWPTEVESILYRHSAIQQACVVGIPDPRRGEAAKAFVILNEDSKGKTSAEEIIQWAKEHMAAYKVPKVVEFRESFPMTSSGKILWRKLKEEEASKVNQQKV